MSLSPAVTETADVVIIGGGIMGVSIALHLVQDGVENVVLLEKEHLGAGSSGKSGAILRQHYSREASIRMARESLQFYRTFGARYGRDIGFEQPGMLFLANESAREALERNVEVQRSVGVDTRVVDAQEVRALEPRGTFGDAVLGAWEPEAAYVNPVRTVYALADVAREHGADIRTEARVSGVLTENGSARGVRRADGAAIHAPVVVNAAGPWAGPLLDEQDLDYPLQAIRPEQAYLEPPGDFGEATTMYADLVTGIYWKPEPAGWTRIGKMSYDGDDDVPDPDDYDEGIDQSFIDFTREAITERLPAFAQATSWGGCGALYTITPDAHPLIGPVPEIDGLFLASGFSGHGFKLAPSVGQGLTALITGGDPGPLDPDLFAVDRLRHDRPVTVPYAYGILG
ncbi:MAG: FAD-dependent oxidoreductase [Bacteroidetes bacterium]|nr:FAD-dependent oxidoreductase [Bacteroidota bacterium]